MYERWDGGALPPDTPDSFLPVSNPGAPMFALSTRAFMKILCILEISTFYPESIYVNC